MAIAGAFMFHKHFLFLFLFNRSPGGTPLKQRANLSDDNDPASLIAQALKKKFASRILHSPRSPLSPNTDENIISSPDSPVAPVS